MSWPLLSKGCGVYKHGQEAVCQQALTATQESAWYDHRSPVLQVGTQFVSQVHSRNRKSPDNSVTINGSHKRANFP